MPQDLPLALTLLAASATLYAVCVRQGSREANPLKPRMIDWRALSVVFGVGFFFALLYTLAAFSPVLPVGR